MKIHQNIFEIIKDARKGASKMAWEIMDMAQQHPAMTRNLLSAAISTFNRWFTTPTYRKFLDLYQLWHYRDEQSYFEVDDFGMDESFLEAMRPIFQFLFFNYFRVDVEGENNITIDGPAMFVANHAGSLAYDGAMTNLAVYNIHPKKRYVRFLVDDFVYYLPFVGTFIQRMGGIRACHENAMRLLDHGHMILVFPEGVKGISKLFDDRYKLQRFGRGGYVRLAMRTGVPIIPTAIIGAEEIHPLIWKSDELGKMLGLPYLPFTPTFPWLGPLGLFPLPTKWRIIFGKPIQFSRYKPKDAENERLVTKISDNIRSKIQKMVDHELQKRESVWY